MTTGMKKPLSIAMSAILLSLSLSACGSNNDNQASSSNSPDATASNMASAEASPSASNTAADPVTYKVLTHYSTDDEKAPADWAAEELKKIYPNVTIKYEPQMNDNGDSLKARIATGDLPDFFNLMPIQFDAAIQSGSILDLTAAWDASTAKADMIQSSLDTQLKYTDGKIWAIPQNGPGIDPLYYNKKVFSDNGVKVPTNYPELLEAVKAFHAAGIVPIPMFAKEAWPIGAFFDMFAMRVNPKGMMALNDGDIKASDPEMADAIGKMAELIKAGIFQKGATSYDYDSARGLFHQGKAAMLINGEWDIGDMVKDFGADIGNIDFLDVYPTTDQGKEDANKYAMPGAAELGGLAVSSKVKDPDQAMQVAITLAKLIAQGGYVKEGRIDSTFKLDGLTSEIAVPDMTKKLLSMSSQYQILGTVEHTLPNKEFSTGFGELLQKLVAGESAADFIKEVDALQAKTVFKK
ncbi:ABC transporter substrate-binding protein [Paenibacillus sp. JDR-2]|uniref:ABC transporter substrate-binding protein n=1 Tax=Paenibacillus sp. (strain JDR-2) TaxID=324057 RepID=UPI0001666D53|nr:extracellular solute-binding protein [Paenibacillus sp. JDR-2]ACT01203.1 extracellular solute-binding protein family 1 [Paenibacillus sp. JDR-2]